VVEAAGLLFRRHGWAGTTMAAVASEAGTAVETVYAAGGSKSALLTAAIDGALVGDDEPRPLLERAEFAALGTGRRAARVKAAASLITRAHARSVALLAALQEAAASDRQARARWRQYEADRRVVIERGLGLVLGYDPGDELVDSMWALAAPEVFVKLTRQRGWTSERYEAWLARSASLLLAPPPP
jgi:AcrR family transcriptional regulator